MNKLATLALLALSLASHARAATIDPMPTIPTYRYDGRVDVSSDTKGVVDDNKSKGFGDSGPGRIEVATTGALAASVIDLGYAPRISTYSGAESHAYGNTNADSSANLYYAFEIVGPSTTNISVLVQAKGQVTTGGLHSFATAFFSLGGPTGYVVSDNIKTGAANHADSFSVDQHFWLSSNTEYLVTMASSTYAYSQSGPLEGSSDANSFVDPYFSIDPGFSDYSLVFSDGINNSLVSPIPLPSSLPLFGAGLLALGAAGYGLKRKKATAMV